MANLLQEIGKKITLIDLIQEVKQERELADMLDDGELKDKISELYFSNAVRGLVRTFGNAAFIYGLYHAFTDPDHLLKYALISVAIPSTSYFLEHKFLNPKVWK